MVTKEQSSLGAESQRRLAASAVETFALPSNDDQLFLPLTELIDRTGTPFSELGRALHANLLGLLSTVSMPYTIAHNSAINRHWQRIRTSERILALLSQAEPNETEEAFRLRREHEALAAARPKMQEFVDSEFGKAALIEDTLEYLDTLRSDESLSVAAREIILQGAVLCWGAFEVLARDCFTAYINSNPDRSLILLADPVAKRRFESPKISLETLAANKFDLSGRMGTLLARQQDLSDVYSVKAIYQALFSENDKLGAALDDPDLRLLSLRRNLIVHQRGVIDEIYATAANSPQHVGERLKVTPTELLSHLNTTLNVSVGLLSAVSAAQSS
jgi:hypothetical protein